MKDPWYPRLSYLEYPLQTCFSRSIGVTNGDQKVVGLDCEILRSLQALSHMTTPLRRVLISELFGVRHVNANAGKQVWLWGACALCWQQRFSEYPTAHEILRRRYFERDIYDCISVVRWARKTMIKCGLKSEVGDCSERWCSSRRSSALDQTACSWRENEEEVVNYLVSSIPRQLGTFWGVCIDGAGSVTFRRTLQSKSSW